MVTRASLPGWTRSESVSLRFMNGQSLTKRTRAGAHFLCAGLLLCGWTPPRWLSPVSAASSRTIGRTRACTANPLLTPSSKKKDEHTTKHPLPAEPPPICIEVEGGALEIQEFLQATAREKAWRIGENRASEDNWSFVRYFGADELDTYADTKVLLETVKFTNGKAAVAVRTTDIGEGYVRVQVSARFQGAGKSTDRISGQPQTSWSLNSKGVLENEVVSALQTQFRPMA